MPARAADIVRFVQIGIDIGGTKMEAAALDPAGLVRARRRVPLPPTYAQVLSGVAALVEALEGEVGPARSVGIGTPGSLSPSDQRLTNAENTPLDGERFPRDIARALARPVRVANDARCFALSEAIDGAGAGADVVFGVILGTGVGGGLVVERAVRAGANAIAGEWGHNSLPWPGAGDEPAPACYCGRRGCIEAYLSGPGLARDHQRATGVSATARDIAEAAAAGEAAAAATLERFLDRLARALAHVVNLLDPDAIVVGGGLSHIDAIYREVPRRWQAHIAAAPVLTRLARARHGDASGVRGAAWLWP